MMLLLVQSSGTVQVVPEVTKMVLAAARSGKMSRAKQNTPIARFDLAVIGFTLLFHTLVIDMFLEVVSM